MNVALIGLPGAGKTTQAIKLSSSLGLLHLCTGDLFRTSVRNQTALGLLARRYMHDGHLVPDEVVDAMIEEWLRKAPPEAGILFDGFPRTTYQADFLNRLFLELGRQLNAVLFLELSSKEAVRRMIERRHCSQCPATFHPVLVPFAECPFRRCHGEHLYTAEDDSPAAAQSRLKAFRRASTPLLRHYQRTGRLIGVSAEGTPDQVQEVVRAMLDTARRRGSGGAVAMAPSVAAAAPPPVASLPLGRRLDLLLIGPPGSGKGTRARQLSEALKLPQVASGDLFRENVMKATPLGRKAKAYMDRGDLVPDSITDAMVHERLCRPDTLGGFILDGYPRTLHQAMALEETLHELNRTLTGVLYVKVADDEIVKRLSGRLTCRQCQAPYHVRDTPPSRPGVCDRCGGELCHRPDDKPSTVVARLRTYHSKTEPVIDFYRRKGLVLEIPGEGDVATAVAAAVRAALGLLHQPLGGTASGTAASPATAPAANSAAA